MGNAFAQRGQSPVLYNKDRKGRHTQHGLRVWRGSRHAAVSRSLRAAREALLGKLCCSDLGASVLQIPLSHTGHRAHLASASATVALHSRVLPCQVSGASTHTTAITTFSLVSGSPVVSTLCLLPGHLPKLNQYPHLRTTNTHVLSPGWELKPADLQADE